MGGSWQQQLQAQGQGTGQGTKEEPVGRKHRRARSGNLKIKTVPCGWSVAGGRDGRSTPSRVSMVMLWPKAGVERS